MSDSDKIRCARPLGTEGSRRTRPASTARYPVRWPKANSDFTDDSMRYRLAGAIPLRESANDCRSLRVTAESGFPALSKKRETSAP